ncbi:hypothetical protein ATCC90586_006667 [Pythium insidiosum]|nr:hypothetical protein ATCC90586_006667 [Pythium insidiosum]
MLALQRHTMGHLDFVLKAIEQFPAMLAAQQHKNGKHDLTGANGPSLVSPQHMGPTSMGDAASASAEMLVNASAMMMSTSMGSNAQFAMTNPISVSTAPPNLSRGLTEMMNGMETPVLMRANSGGLSDFMRSLDDHEGNDGSAMFYQSMAGSAQPSNSQVADAIEMQVFYVLARMITLNSTSAIGFPAFDAAMNLLGFYQEARETSTTEVVFVPVSDISAITQVEIAQTQRLLRTELKESSSAVHTLARCNNDLVKLKEDVILFHWNAKDRAAAPSW